MREARILMHGTAAGVLQELQNKHYEFFYYPDYQGPPISLTMPTTQRIYHFDQFPSFFEGLLPEGAMLDALLRRYKLDNNDYFAQLLQVGQDVVGAVTIEKLT
jgi:serine/threonine-protein kinase HipA